MLTKKDIWEEEVIHQVELLQMKVETVERLSVEMEEMEEYQLELVQMELPVEVDQELGQVVLVTVEVEVALEMEVLYLVRDLQPQVVLEVEVEDTEEVEVEVVMEEQEMVDQPGLVPVEMVEPTNQVMVAMALEQHLVEVEVEHMEMIT
jgi:hypothetical protein